MSPSEWACHERATHTVLRDNVVSGRFERGVSERGVFAFACQYIVSPCGRTGNRTVTQMEQIACNNRLPVHCRRLRSLRHYTVIFILGRRTDVITPCLLTPCLNLPDSWPKPLQAESCNFNKCIGRSLQHSLQLRLRLHPLLRTLALARACKTLKEEAVALCNWSAPSSALQMRRQEVQVGFQRMMSRSCARFRKSLPPYQKHGRFSSYRMRVSINSRIEIIIATGRTYFKEIVIRLQIHAFKVRILGERLAGHF